MNIQLAEKIANAILYEGYILYPYRPSAVKNRQRWTFGGIFPQDYSLAHNGAEPWQTQTECLVVAAGNATLTVRVRFLHLVWREIGRLDPPVAELPESSELTYRLVDSLSVGKEVYYTWQEAVEREVELPNLALAKLQERPRQFTFEFPASRTVEPLRHQPDGEVVGVIVRQQQAITGEIEVMARRQPQAEEKLYKVTIRVKNLTPAKDAAPKNRNEALLQAFASTHAILSLHTGQFVSLLDPPAQYRPLAEQCHNIGVYPVLVGEAGEQDMMLSSPIILYDYPEIAPESPGDMFDGTEIDELLTLRIMAMTDAEKREMRQVDERARALLDRTERLPQEQLLKLHGTIRSLRPLDKET